MVRRNLWDFLDRVSFNGIANIDSTLLPFSPKYLWIDQICINQSDAKEKNHQVKRMALIFEQAGQVIVWLGRGVGGRGDLLDTLERLRCRVNMSTFLDRLDKKELDFFGVLLSNPFWQRLWIIQEVLLAQDILICYGNWAMQWDHLYRFTKIQDKISSSRSRALSTEHHSVRESSRKLLQARQHRPYYATRVDHLSYYLQKYSMLDCEDPRDKVYGLLALVRENTSFRSRMKNPPPWCSGTLWRT